MTCGGLPPTDPTSLSIFSSAYLLALWLQRATSCSEQGAEKAASSGMASAMPAETARWP